MALLGNVTDTMSSLAVVGEEPIVLSNPHVSLVLQKLRSDTKGELTVGNEKVSVQFPDLTELLNGESAGKDIDVQVIECYCNEPKRLVIFWDNFELLLEVFILYTPRKHCITHINFVLCLRPVS